MSASTVSPMVAPFPTTPDHRKATAEMKRLVSHIKSPELTLAVISRYATAVSQFGFHAELAKIEGPQVATAIVAAMAEQRIAA